jgi:hypothetical protein
MEKYPFIVTVYRLTTLNKPLVQHFNFDDIGLANMKLSAFSGDRSVIRVTLGLIMKSVTYQDHMPDTFGNFRRSPAVVSRLKVSSQAVDSSARRVPISASKAL